MDEYIRFPQRTELEHVIVMPTKAVKAFRIQLPFQFLVVLLEQRANLQFPPRVLPSPAVAGCFRTKLFQNVVHGVFLFYFSEPNGSYLCFSTVWL
ncbi:MAG: hypothetical protein IJ009_03380 [Clostridia bacterium]|nr:hypothetical protein [Clostridia bacterium]